MSVGFDWLPAGRNDDRHVFHATECDERGGDDLA